MTQSFDLKKYQIFKKKCDDKKSITKPDLPVGVVTGTY